MKPYLIFQLYGAMVSWGDIAVGDIRPSYRQPSKSAVVGLLAAALGIKRDETLKQRELFKLVLSMRVDSFGTTIEDYHTVQTPSEQAIKHDRTKEYWTRADEIAAIEWRVIQSQSNAGAIQSRRTYHCDALYTIAISESDAELVNWSVVDGKIEELEQVISFLNSPHYTLYLGRKSCPLALPLQAQIQQAADFRQAIQLAKFAYGEELQSITHKQKHVAWYSEEPFTGNQMKITRRDQPVNKQTWQFTEREEFYASESKED